MKKNVAVTLLLICSGVLGFVVSWHRHRPSADDIQMIQTFHRPAVFVKQLEGDPDAGRKIFKEFCATCHNNPPMIDVRAPLIGDKTAWHALQKADKKALLKITTQGAGAMPARGGCFECSDEQLLMTINYILLKSQ